MEGIAWGWEAGTRGDTHYKTSAMGHLELAS